MPEYNAVIFDMDGLLLDTESIALATFIAACRETGFEPDLTVYRRCIGTTYQNTREILTQGYGKAFDYERVSKSWSRRFAAETENRPVPLKEAARGILDDLAEAKTKMAVVTSTRRSTAVKELTNVGIRDFFALVIGGDEVQRGKPEPDIYLKACAALAEAPEKCLALEDSDNGVRAAWRAGLTVIQVPDLVEPAPAVRALGHRIVKSLREVQTILRLDGQYRQLV